MLITDTDTVETLKIVVSGLEDIALELEKKQEWGAVTRLCTEIEDIKKVIKKLTLEAA